MRKIILGLLLRLYGRAPYQKLSNEAMENLLHNIATEEGLERFPDFLQQCADTYRNQYLYSGDPQFKGSVLAMVQLRDKILENKVKKRKKKLTEDGKIGKVEPAY